MSVTPGPVDTIRKHWAVDLLADYGCAMMLCYKNGKTGKRQWRVAIHINADDTPAQIAVKLHSLAAAIAKGPP